MAFVQRRSIVAVERCDYADASSVRFSDDRHPNCGGDGSGRASGAPSWLRSIVLIAHRHVLRLELAPPATPNHLLGWEIVDAEPEPHEDARRRPTPRGRACGQTNPAVYRSARDVRQLPATDAGRPIWTAVAPIHRAVAPRFCEGPLLRRAVNCSPDDPLCRPDSGVVRRKSWPA